MVLEVLQRRTSDVDLKLDGNSYIEGAKVIDMLGLFRAVRPEKSTTGYTYSKNISNVDISGPIYNTIQSI